MSTLQLFANGLSKIFITVDQRSYKNLISNVLSTVPSPLPQCDSTLTAESVFIIDTGDAKPIMQRPYRLPHSTKIEVNKEVQTLLDQGIIRESTSEWCSPIVVRQKFKDGKPAGVRMCVDFRKVNLVTKEDPFPLPRTDELIEGLAAAKFMTTFDLTKGYYQVPMEKDSVAKTAFVTPNGKYEHLRLPFGTKTASGHYQRMVQRILSGCEKFAASFIDDIVIHDTDFVTHLKHVREVLGRLRKA